MTPTIASRYACRVLAAVRFGRSGDRFELASDLLDYLGVGPLLLLELCETLAQRVNVCRYCRCDRRLNARSAQIFRLLQE